MALADVAAIAKNYDLAEQYIKDAMEDADSPEIQERLGRLMLEKMDILKSSIISKQATPEETVTIEKAIEYIAIACKKWQEQRNTIKVIEAKLTLAGAYRAIDKEIKYESNIRSAYELDNNNEFAVTEYAALLANEGKIDDALKVLLPLINSPKYSVAIDLYTQILIRRNKDDDKENALNILLKHASLLDCELPFYRFNYIRKVLILMVELKGKDTSIEYLEGQESNSLSDISRRTLEAYIYILIGDKTEATQKAIVISKEPDNKFEWYEIRDLATLLQELNEWKLALNAWKKIVSDEYLSSDLFQMLNAARQINDYKTILQYCEKLRNKNIWHWDIVNHELDCREKFNDVENAIRVMQEYLVVCNNEKQAKIIRLRMSCLGLRTNNYAIIERNKEKLPDVECVSPLNGRLISQILKYGEKPIDAVDYAYELWRLHTDNEDANLAFISTLLPIGPTIKLPEYDIVEDGVAVLYEEKETKCQTWHIIENSPLGDIKNSRNEYSLDHSISQNMLGKREGDEFYLVQDELQDRKAVVSKIQSKYFYRCQKCFEEFSRKFPDSRSLRSFLAINADGSLNLEPMKRLVERDNSTIEQAMEMYNTELIPIQMLAQIKHVSEFIVIHHYATCPELKMKTCFGSQDEWNSALISVGKCSNIVLDITALITLLLLDNDFWGKVDKNLIVSQGTFDCLNKIEIVQDDYCSEGGWISCPDGRLTIQNKDIERAKLEQERIKSFIENVKSKCQIESGIELIEMDAEIANTCFKAIGQANAEALSLASHDNNVLWTDDLAIACLAKSEFGCERVWTQCMVSLYAGYDAPALNLKLLQYGYAFTKIGLDDLKAALEQSSWQLNNDPFKSAIEVFSDNSITLGSICGLLANFIKYVWQNTTEFTAQQITLAIFNNISRRELGFLIIEMLPLDDIFGVDCISAYKVNNVRKDWLRLNIGYNL